MKKLILMAATLAALSTTSACHREPRYNQTAQQQVPMQQQGYGDPCMQSQNPQQCAQVRDAGGDVNDYMSNGLGMYMLGSMMTPYGQRSYLYPNPAYHGIAHPIPSYANSRVYVSRATYHPYSVVHHVTTTTYPVTRTVVTSSAPTQRTGFFGLRRSTPVTTTAAPATPFRSTTTTSPGYTTRSTTTTYSRPATSSYSSPASSYSRPSSSSSYSSSSYSSRPSSSSMSSSSYSSSRSSFSSSSSGRR